MIDTPTPEPQLNMTPTELAFVVLFAEMTLQTAEDQVAQMRQDLSQVKSQSDGSSESQTIIADLETRLARKDRRLDQMSAAIAQMKARLVRHS